MDNITPSNVEGEIIAYQYDGIYSDLSNKSCLCIEFFIPLLSIIIQVIKISQYKPRIKLLESIKPQNIIYSSGNKIEKTLCKVPIPLSWINKCIEISYKYKQTENSIKNQNECSQTIFNINSMMDIE